ncbi:MAG: cyclic pyranopterin monophosphate synthase MoaC [Candidatus Omnitrophica bacterium]|nr:cyclic pyranopterin monophosphate synthase MoaC [Candidatus Omnitrophota bacterium]
MIEISDKIVTKREAVAQGLINISPGVIKLIKDKKIPKGDVLETARVAGILAAKQTPNLLPLCHPIAIEFAQIEFKFGKNQIVISAVIRGHAKTGFEMEALTAVSVSALTIYDMCKAFDKDMVIGDVKVMCKSGGKSGNYVRKS